MISLSNLDITIIFLLFFTILFVGIYVGRSSGKNTNQYFLSGRNMPWWLLGISMVATTFSTDTPNLVTDIVRTNGVSGNWVWWAFLVTGLLTVFVYAKLWRKSEVKTDIEFYELRYGGKPAHFLRGFRAVYLGILFNILAMAGVTLAAIKIGQVMLGLSPVNTVLIAGFVTVVFSAIGGFKGVVYTDFILFFIAMIGSFGAAYFIVGLPEVGGLEALISHNNVKGKLNILPSLDDTETFITLIIIPLAVQWWSSWYPGSEPGGGGYVAQRMLAAKNENHAISATFFYNIMHYALRPWPWIVVALASLIFFPDLASIQEAFPNVTKDKLGQDLAYSAMLTKLPSGLLGLVLASLAAAYMSTISTHLNWGASYVVNDFYKQQIKPDASEKHLVNIGRITTIILMIVSSIIALSLTNALQLFDIILMFGAGTGLIFILRWFWWRINAWTEISAMLASGIISILLTFTSQGKALFAVGGIFPGYIKFPFVVLFSTIIWLIVTYLTPPESDKVLFNFYKKIQPGGPGWKRVLNRANKSNITIVKTTKKWSVPNGILAMILGCVLIYACMFAIGNLIYGKYEIAILLFGIALIFCLLLLNIWKKIKGTVL
ncbi:MAG: Sodium/glucose cotransporter [Flavobacterium sp. SCGC AAA160-P02]|nr:MAG: Sodium/glucose cotransporter [Flavobacterium sp. SCGC AAA160-P02]